MTEIFMISRAKSLETDPYTNPEYEILPEGHFTIDAAKNKLLELINGGVMSFDRMMGEDKDGIYHSIVKVELESITVH